VREVRNVVACVPGVGDRKDEYIVVGAHYDHLGRGETGTLSLATRNQIHNGADDNASGTAAMLQLARRFAARQPARTIVFCAFTGEERGLLGSAQFVNNPPIPLDKIVAMLNLDMVGRLQGETLEIGGTGTAAEFDAIVAASDAESPLKVKSAGEMVGGRGGLGPSDHASFAAKKIPVIFIWTGTHVDYHRPTDDVEKINFNGMARILDVCDDVVERLATMPRTQYVDKYDRSMGFASGGPRVRLGIMPDYSFEDKGVKVSSTFPDTPAAKAGIKEGDIIVQFGQMQIESMQDYMDALGNQKPGDTVKLSVMRDGKRLEFQATLGSPRRG
jgi:Zn-dependent M28 family amino/carboxypeptidase